MDIQKYKAKTARDGIEVTGYIVEIREFISNGSYGKGTEYIMCVTEKSSNCNFGTHKVIKETIKKIK